MMLHLVRAIKVLNFVKNDNTAWRGDAPPFCSLSQLLETKADSHLLFNKSTPVLLLYISPTNTHEKKSTSSFLSDVKHNLICKKIVVLRYKKQKEQIVQEGSVSLKLETKPSNRV